LVTFVVPKLTEQFAHAGQSLPLITSLLIGLSQGWCTPGRGC
jgi:general secretion pathway protein F